ncbi:sulfatase [uncultured Gimesia sp.]|uniref:sulfatase n=1 Tax=uncultured Gimesia sp. TaxID=1678688 RepID=UPI0030D8FBE0|tara:strand:- start:37712 stop:39892 length:2181 start_codon:yes stop_codon:yes gene_type:complete
MYQIISCTKDWGARFFPNRGLALVVFVIIFIELLLHSFHEQSYWDNEELNIIAKIGLVGLTFVLWSVIAWIGFWYIQLMQFIGSYISSNIYKHVVYFLAIIPVISCINLYVLSWYYFWRLNVFPTLDAFWFATINANMLQKYFWQAERFMLVASLGCCFAITLLSFLALKKNIEHICKIENRFSILQFIILAISVNILVFASTSYTNDSSPQYRASIDIVKNPWAPYSYELCYHVDPAMTIAGNLLSSTKPKIEGEIPLKYLSPLASFKPESFPELKTENKKNVILITIESLRSDSILMKHQGIMVMPHVASMAYKGCFFPNCYSCSTHSDYSDPSILCSLYPLRTAHPHFYSKKDPWSKVLIYDLLKQYGYATAIFSSQNEAWSNMHLFYESPNLDILFDSRAYKGPTISEKGDFSMWQKETGMVAGKLDDAITVRHAIKWIKDRQDSQTSFFLSMNLQTSHFPYERPDRESGPFQPSTLNSGVSLLDYNKEDIPIVKNAYYNALSYIDSQIKYLTDELDETGISDNTIIIITGDHGEAFLENKVAGHAGEPLETVIRTGLIITNPKLIMPKNDEYLVQAIDIVPTILGILELPPHPSFQGINILSGERPPNNERLIFIHCCNPFASIDSVISGTGWKYIQDENKYKTELFFRPTDLEIHENLAPQEKTVTKILQNICREWRTNQLLYYSYPKYYNIFNPPKTPFVEKVLIDRLIKHAELRAAGQ